MIYLIEEFNCQDLGHATSPLVLSAKLNSIMGEYLANPNLYRSLKN